MRQLNIFNWIRQTSREKRPSWDDLLNSMPKAKCKDCDYIFSAETETHIDVWGLIVNSNHGLKYRNTFHCPCCDGRMQWIQNSREGK